MSKLFKKLSNSSIFYTKHPNITKPNIPQLSLSSIPIINSNNYNEITTNINKIEKRKFSNTSSNIPSNIDFDGIGRLNHIAIATPNLEESSLMYKNILGASDVSLPIDLPEHGVTTVFVTLNNTKIELLHPFGNNSPIKNFLDKNKNGGLHHICLEVNDINNAVKILKLNNKRILGDIKIGAHGLPVIFIHPKDMGGVLVELEEIKN